MKNLGNWLQAARESKGVSLQEAEEATRIRVRYLEALEQGDYGAMSGGAAQVRGFVRRYATFLGLTPEEAIARYEQDEGEAQIELPAEPAPVVSAEMVLAPPVWRWLPVVAIGGALLLLVLGGLWLAKRNGLLTLAQSTPATATVTTAATTVASVTAQPSPAAATAAPTPLATPTFAVTADGVTMNLQAQEHVWVRVTVDGFIAFEGMLSPGTDTSWTAEEMVAVETGNGAGVVAVVNGQPQGVLGGRGQVCARGWGVNGEVNIPSPASP